MNVLRRTLRDAGGLMLVLGVVCALAAVVVFTGLDRRAETQSLAETRVAAQALALGIDSGGSVTHLLNGAGRAGFAYALMLDNTGAVLARTPAGGLTDVQARGLPQESRAFVPVSGGPRFSVATAPVMGGGHVALLREVVSAVPVLPLLLWSLGAWLLSALFIIAATFRGRRLDPGLRNLTEQLAEQAADPGDRALAVERHGEAVHLLFDLAEHLDAVRHDRDDARAVANAFMQMGSHYTLLATIDGRVIDANPALLARLGVDPADLQAQARDILREFLPLDEVRELANRSLSENITLTGLSCVATVDGQPRSLEAAIRGLRLRDGIVFVLLLTDRDQERELERQIDQFSDSIELMVDQRVSRITAGQASAEQLLGEAGLVLVHLDAAGAIRRMNKAAEKLTGRTQFTLTQLSDLTSLVSHDPVRQQAFERWFWSDDDSVFGTTMRRVTGDRSVTWIRGVERRGSESVRRVLAGMVDARERAVGLPGGGNPLQSLDILAAELDPLSFSPDSRAYVEVIREAVRRLESAGAPSGDGAMAGIRSART